MPRRAPLDDIDLDILRRLQRNGRVSNAELAREVNLSPPSTLQRVRRLERSGVVRAYGALVDAAEVGLGVTVFVHVTLSLHQDKPIEGFREYVRRLPEVLECHNVSGDCDFLLKVVSEDIAAYESFVRGKLSRAPGVERLRSSFVLSTAKHTLELPF
ncbi:MAG: Lrp/AsnC family transcriptional regulator [Fimbriimonadaceae bacterium]|nr:Lrp/AsnC family transcriptional regulator [Fimbriimonadaceae bacterium]